MDEIERLRGEKNNLLQRLTEINEILSAHDKLIMRATALLGGEPQPMSSQGNTGTKYGRPDVPQTTIRPPRAAKNTGDDASDSRPKRYRPSSPEVTNFERVVMAILSESHVPLDRHALLDAVMQRGIVVPGLDPKNTLGARMSRMNGVENVKGKGYWPKSRMLELSSNEDNGKRQLPDVSDGFVDDEDLI
jgi:hypothetical protein